MNDGNAPRGNLRLGTVDVQWGKGAQRERGPVGRQLVVVGRVGAVDVRQLDVQQDDLTLPVFELA